MIRSRTVIVLGAGASKPYGFPTGPELRHDLVTRILARPKEAEKAKLAGRAKPRLYEYYEILTAHSHNSSLLDECQKALSRSWATSVDMFMSTQRPEIRVVCKAAIVLAIAEAESTEDGLFFAPPNVDWFRYLWRYLHKGCKTLQQFRDLNSLAFVTFNYDRTLEWSLANAVMYAYGTGFDEALKAIPRIVHFYGDLGLISERRYGAPPDLDGLPRATERILVVDESENLTKNMANARELLRQAERVLFLGFGYDETNMRLLGMTSGDRVLPGTTECYGTVFGLQDAEAQTAALQFARCDSGTSQWNRFKGPMTPEADALMFLRMNHNLLT